jgi:hypothetical protein
VAAAHRRRGAVAAPTVPPGLYGLSEHPLHPTPSPARSQRSAKGQEPRPVPRRSAPAPPVCHRRATAARSTVTTAPPAAAVHRPPLPRAAGPQVGLHFLFLPSSAMDGPCRSRVITVADTLWSISSPRIRFNGTARGSRSSFQAQFARSWSESAGASSCPRRRPPLPRSPTLEAGRVRVSCTVECGSLRRTFRVSRYRWGGRRRRERAGQCRSPASVLLSSGVHLTRGPVPLCGTGAKEQGERSN